MGHSIWLWLGFLVFIAGLLAVDLGLLHRRARDVGFLDSLKLSAVYIALAGVFAAGLFHFQGYEEGLAFTTGYLIEKSLSLDNISSGCCSWRAASRCCWPPAPNRISPTTGS